MDRCLVMFYDVKVVEHNRDGGFDFENPVTQKEFADLQLIDYLTGQTDRHPGNIYVDSETGEVTGIDNDQAFGSQAKINADYHYGLPELDYDTAVRLKNMPEADFREAISLSKRRF